MAFRLAPLKQPRFASAKLFPGAKGISDINYLKIFYYHASNLMVALKNAGFTVLLKKKVFLAAVWQQRS